MKLQMLAGVIALGIAAPALAQGGPQGPQTRAEFQAAQKAQFAGFDANKDGSVTKEEITAAVTARMEGRTPPAQMLDMLFARLDTNGDGKATAEEADASAMSRFDAWDANKDGTLTPEERRAGMQAMARPQ
jgi:hypothetical protein